MNKLSICLASLLIAGSAFTANSTQTCPPDSQKAVANTKIVAMAFTAQIQRLCKNGDTGPAENYAAQSAKNMRKDADLAQGLACAPELEKTPDFAFLQTEKTAGKGICDTISH